MRIAAPAKLFFACTLLLLFLFSAAALPPSPELYKMLPERVGNFTALPSVRPLGFISKEIAQENFRAQVDAEGKQIAVGGERDYLSASGGKFTVELFRLRADSDAYALLTQVAERMRDAALPSQTVRPINLGTYGVASPGRIAFFKGTTFVRVTNTGKQSVDSAEALALARLFAEKIDSGAGDIPVLVKHLPDWQTSQERATYAVSLNALKEAAGKHLVLDAISFEGGTEAVAASYGQARLVIVEYTTPQLATSNDARIRERINELRAAGQSVPSAYQRVGNYSVFVFDAPDEIVAKQLISQISYEQEVQWLGPNPRALERAQRQYTETTANVIIAVLKASGLSVLLCLGIGGLFGGIMFRHRRAQQTTAAAYSDAGGLQRLNLDDMNVVSDPARLLSRGDS